MDNVHTPLHVCIHLLHPEPCAIIASATCALQVEALEQQVVAQVTEASRKRKRAVAAAAADKDATQQEGQEGGDGDDGDDGDDDKEDEVLVGKMEGSKGGDDEEMGWVGVY